jgi:hypothetical protein
VVEVTNPTKEDTMTDNDKPVTAAEIAAVTIAGLPELVRRMLANGCAPEPQDEATDATPGTTR